MGKKKNNIRNRRRPSGATQSLAYRGIVRGMVKCPSQPPMLTPNVTLRKVFRFIAANSVSENTAFVITPSKVCGLLSFGTSATQVTQVFESCRINFISIWSSVNNGAGTSIPPRTVALIFSGGAAGTYGANVTHSRTSVGMTRVACLKAFPERSSQAGQWQPGSTALTPSYFTINCGEGSIIDIDADFTVTTDARTAGNSVTVGTAVLGEMYYMALDNAYSGSGSVGNLLVPMGELATTT